MHPVVAFLLNALALYAATGIVTALAFVTLPGAAALWPYVLMRWLKAGAR